MSSKELQRCVVLLERLSSLRVESTSDLQIIVESKTFHVHRLILVSCSQYFRSLLESRSDEDKNNPIELADVRREPFECLLDCMYGEPVDLESKSLEEIVEGVKLAKKFYVDIFIDECKGFVLDWRNNGLIGTCFGLAGMLDLKEEAEKMSRIVSTQFQSFVREPGLASLIEAQITINFAEVSLALMTSALDVFQAGPVRNRLSTVKLKEIVHFLTLHPDLSPEDVFRLLKEATIECLPHYLLETEMKESLENFTGHPRETIVNAFNRIYKTIGENISSFSVNLCIFQKKILSFKLADYHPGHSSWREINHLTGFVVHEYFARRNNLYLVGTECFGIYDLRRKKLIERRKLPFPNLEFENCCVYVSKDTLYVLAKREEHLTLAMYNIEKKDFLVKDLKKTSFKNVYMVIKEDVVYYVLNEELLSYDPVRDLTKTLVIFNEESKLTNRAKPSLKMAIYDKHIFVFNQYSCYRFPILDNAITFDTSSFEVATRVYEEIVCCHSGPRGLVIAVTSSEFRNELKLYEYSDDKKKFVPLGFLPQQKLVSDENVSFSMRYLEPDEK